MLRLRVDLELVLRVRVTASVEWQSLSGSRHSGTVIYQQYPSFRRLVRVQPFLKIELEW
jgi:hypothetical protein